MPKFEDKSFEEIFDSVISSNVFGKSERQAQLFKYLLKASFEDRSDKLTAYDIAYDVFKRGEDFDPSIDAIVRTEMGRLRKRLKLFNASFEEYSLSVPRASWQVVLEPKVKIAPKKKKSNVLGLALGALAMLLFFVGNNFYVSNNANQKMDRSDKASLEIDRLLIGINFEIQGEQGGSAFSIATKVKHHLETIITTDRHAVTTGSANFDYQVKIKAELTPENDGYTIYISVQDRSGNIYHSNYFLVESFSKKDNLRKIAREIYELEVEKVYYGFLDNENINSARKQMYRCFVNSQRFTLPEYDGIDKAEFYTCLDPAKVTSNYDKIILHTARADVLTQQYFGNVDVGVNSPLEKAEWHLSQARKLNGSSHYYYYVIAMRTMIPGLPNNRVEFKLFLEEFERKFKTHPEAFYLIGLGKVYYMAELDFALEIEKFLKNEEAYSNALHNEVPAVYYLQKKDWQKANYFLEHLPASRHPKKVILKTVVYCGLFSDGDESILDQIDQQLSQISLKDSQEYVQKQTWHPTIKRAYLPLDVLTDCPLVSD